MAQSIIFLLRILKLIFVHILEIIALILSIYGLYTLYRDEFKKNTISIELASEQMTSMGYESTFFITNTGEAISREDIYENFKVTIHDKSVFIYEICRDKIKLFSPNTSFTKWAPNSFIINFDLLNQNQVIEFKCITDRRIGRYNFTGRAKNVLKVRKYHFEIYPSLLKRLNVYSLVGIFAGIFFFLDATFLILKDKELQEIYNHIKTLNLKTNKDIFIQKYKEKYDKYDVIFKVLSKDSVFKEVEKSVNNIDAKNIEQTKIFISRITSASVQYWIRSIGLLIGPACFIISLIYFIYTILKYSSF